ncbi:hypothetical protein NDU88_001747 [Pleurodeles waltl]|uniref:Uncharacterized protein n=1 Tax=Pleurodeles waltl TaxID=8319 RepID=A0AAV7Q6Z9_PLEWA|nr:hypothetical protein NDU88_001747 [Pleurodeles waltl]
MGPPGPCPALKRGWGGIGRGAGLGRGGLLLLGCPLSITAYFRGGGLLAGIRQGRAVDGRDAAATSLAEDASHRPPAV